MAWTDERVEKLKELWADGLTASQIAKALGGVSRNAVIGKVHRLGLSNRSAVAKPAAAETSETPAPKKTAEPVVEEPKLVEPKQKPVEVVPAVVQDDVEQPNPIAALAAEVERSARKLSLLELNERTCKWPIGDPSTDDFYFCGLACAAEKPYCSAHVAVAYQPMSSRRDRDRSRSRAGAA
ncbi:MAG: GcrA cell cycle regulator [Rhodobacteraceae bacterium]|nr:GcrA cell cycle regulator [Paracoccaceae bacterium]